MASRRVRRPVAGGLALLFGATLVAAAQTLPPRLLDAPELYCETARASFERTSKWARDLATALDSLDVEGLEATVVRLAAIRDGLTEEASMLQTHAPPPGAEPVRTHGTAAIGVLLEITDPRVVEFGEEEREQVGAYIKEQFVAARGEARLAATALRQHEPNCPVRRANGVLQLLGFGS
jgi:hypothetical protein